jgi:hypothetical protein
MAARKARKQESRLKAASNSNSMIVNQAASNAGFDLRRYAIKPRPATPRIIIAQVEGSGTPEVTVAPTTVTLNELRFEFLRCAAMAPRWAA